MVTRLGGLRGPIVGALVAALAALALPASAAAQAPRTWVSGVGDDVNPCSRTAPCKTWAGAISKTAVGGEIDALDPGGFGSVTITKAITLNGAGTNAIITPNSGSFGIAVSAPGAHVVINDLTLDGVGVGTNAIKINSAGSVRVQNSDIHGWVDSGIDDESGTATIVDADNTSISNNGGDGVLLAPPATLAGSVTLSNDAISSNACGIVATSFGMPASPSFGTNCGVNGSSMSVSAATTASATNTSITNNAGAGVLANGGSATDYVSNDTITGNGVGLQELAGGQIIEVGPNTVLGNVTNGSPTSTQSSAPPPAAADVELISCRTVKGKKAQKCTGRLVPASVAKVKKRGRRVQATLSRGGKVYGVGTVRLGSGGSEGALSPRGHVKTGRYKLTLSRNGRLIAERTVVMS